MYYDITYNGNNEVSLTIDDLQKANSCAYSISYNYYTTSDSDLIEYKELLQELVNVPPIKLPLWIVQHQEQLHKLGIKIKEK